MGNLMSTKITDNKAQKTLEEFKQNLENFQQKFAVYSDVYHQFDEELRERVGLLRGINNEIRRCQQVELTIQDKLVHLNQKHRDREEQFHHLEEVCRQLINCVEELEQEYAEYQSRFSGS